MTLSSWRSRTFNASSSASMDRISCRISTRLLSGTTSATVISSAVSVFGGALPTIVPSTRLRSACSAGYHRGQRHPGFPHPAAGSSRLALHNEQVVRDAVRLVGSRGCLEADKLLARADPALIGCLRPPRAACLTHEFVVRVAGIKSVHPLGAYSAGTVRPRPPPAGSGSSSEHRPPGCEPPSPP